MSSIGASTSALPIVPAIAAPARSDHRPAPDAVLSPVAQRLGMGLDDLKRELEQGTSLSAVAASRGVSRDELIEAVKQGLAAAEPLRPGGPAAPDRQVRPPIDRVAEAIARGDMPALPAVGPPSQAGLDTSTHQGTQHGGNRHGGGTSGRGDRGAAPLTKVASMLDMPESAVADALRSGSTLGQLAERADVNFAILLRSVSDGMLYDARL